jgi:transcriptional regulator with XRE-family HTH domain
VAAISSHGIARDRREELAQAAPLEEAVAGRPCRSCRGVNRNYIGMLEREENAATVDMLEKLANVLDVDPVEVFERPSRKASHGKR